MLDTWGRSLGREDPLEKEMATHSSTPAWKIPWTEEPGGLQSMGSQRVRHNGATLLTYYRHAYVFSHFSHVQLFMTPWTIACQISLFMRFFQEYWSWLPCPLQGIFPTQGSNPHLLYHRQILYHWASREAPTYRNKSKILEFSHTCFGFLTDHVFLPIK